MLSIRNSYLRFGFRLLLNADDADADDCKRALTRFSTNGIESIKSLKLFASSS